jgi:hypothetical protein
MPPEQLSHIAGQEDTGTMTWNRVEASALTTGMGIFMAPQVAIVIATARTARQHPVCIPKATHLIKDINPIKDIKEARICEITTRMVPVLLRRRLHRL